MRKKFYSFLMDCRGVTGIEYGLILGGIGLSLTTGAFMFGEEFSAMLGAINLGVESATTIQ